jgi:hypothetical protein
MVSKAWVGFVSFVIGEKGKITLVFLSIALMSALLSADLIFQVQLKRSFIAAMVFLPLLSVWLFWLYLRRYLVVHPRAGESGVDNYFVGLNYKEKTLRFWRAGNFCFKEGGRSWPESFSIALVDDMPRTKNTRKFVHVIGSFQLPLQAGLPGFFPAGVTIRINLCSGYHPEEVIRLMVSVYVETGNFYSSYEEYLKDVLGSFLSDSAHVLGEGFFSPRELEQGNSFQAQKRIESFLQECFKPRLPSNVHSVAYSFGSME